MNSISSLFNIKPRILIVDRNAHTQFLYKELVSRWGFTPVLAQGIGEDLLKDAKRKVREYRCQLALVDMRLIDNQDENDFSGLALVTEIKPAISFVLSGPSNIADVRMSYETGAASFIGKGESPKVLKEKLEGETNKICAVKKDITIGPDDILDHIVTVLFENIPIEYQDQIADIFVRLFPKAKRLHLERLDIRPIILTYSTVPRPKSVILKVHEDNKQPVIVKLARAQKMSVEVERFQNYIQGYLRGHFHPSLSNPIILWDIGGAIYTSLGSTNSNTFSKYYAEASLSDIDYSLTQFFCETWLPLYQEAKQCKNISLFKEYCKVWGNEWYERVSRFITPNMNDLLGEEFPKNINLINPIAWLKENAGYEALIDRSVISHTALAVTHGDLHGDNLLIDDHRNAWVIDLERSGEGHILQDFVELEGDLINRLLSTTINISAFFQLCLYITQNTDLREFENLSQIGGKEVGKALHTISLLRKLARECSGISDARQYLLGLLFNTIFRATIVGNTAHEISQQRALILASIICHRLDTWEKTWPPLEWPGILQ